MTRRLTGLLLILSVILTGACGFAHSDPLTALVNDGLARGLFPGAVVLVIHDGEVVAHRAYGYAISYSPHKLPDQRLAMQPDTVFDLASLTKPFTAWAVLNLAEAGLVALDAPAASYLPEFAHPAITLKQLLAHRSGLPAWLPLSDLDTPRARQEAVLTAPLATAPGSERRYSDLGYLVLGWVVEAVSGQTLDAYLKARLFAPLGMSATRFTPPPAWRVRIAATEVQPGTGRKPVWGEVHDENAWALGGVAGHAGLFSTALDLAIFLQQLLAGGQYGDRQAFWAGWEQGAAWMGRFAEGTAYGHTGFTGTSVIVDPGRGLALLALTNRVHPSREPNLQPWRRQLSDTVAALFERE